MLLLMHKFDRLQASSSLIVKSISHDSYYKRREENAALELSREVENKEPCQRDGRNEDLEGIGAMFYSSEDITAPQEGKFYKEITDCLTRTVR